MYKELFWNMYYFGLKTPENKFLTFINDIYIDSDSIWIENRTYIRFSKVKTAVAIKY